jgi:uncharacterized membrane protein
MFVSLLRTAIARPDRRPLYRRIFTHRRQDILHKISTRTIFCVLAFSLSYIATNSVLYYLYERPRQKREQEALERELIEADFAGFKVK